MESISIQKIIIEGKVVILSKRNNVGIWLLVKEWLNVPMKKGSDRKESSVARGRRQALRKLRFHVYSVGDARSTADAGEQTLPSRRQLWFIRNDYFYWLYWITI